jgi:hypothetical protein
MSLPDGELHRPKHWILKEKRKIQGIGLHGFPVITNFTSFVCEKCDNTYTRFPTDQEFKDLEVDYSNWSWGWVRL